MSLPTPRATPHPWASCVSLGSPRQLNPVTLVCKTVLVLNSQGSWEVGAVNAGR